MASPPALHSPCQQVFGNQDWLCNEPRRMVTTSNNEHYAFPITSNWGNGIEQDKASALKKIKQYYGTEKTSPPTPK
jgi:hypothetical protein